MKKRIGQKILAFALAAACVTGCATPGSSSTATTAAAGTTAGGETQAGETAAQTDAGDGKVTITYAQSSDIAGLDPRNGTSTVTAAMLSQVYSSLVKTDEDFNIVCDAAESYEVVDDTTYKFTLKKGIKFHDGTELTSEDVKYTLDTIREEDATYKLKSDFSFMYCEPIDDYNLYIKTDEPNASTLLRLKYISIIPKHYVEEVGDDEFNIHPIGSGPYKVVEWKKDESITLEAFDDYFGGKPQADTVICKVIPEASARIAALEAGEVDLIAAVTTSQVDRLKSLSNIEVVSKPTTRTAYFTMNSLGDSAVTDVRVRKAINMAIDRDTIVQGVLDGYGQAVNSLALPIFEYYDPDVKGYDYDPEGAKALLAEAGYADGLDLEMEGSFSGLSNASDVAQAVAAQLAEVGINVTVVEKDSDTIRDEYQAKTTSPLTFFSFGGPYNNINLIYKCVLGTGERYSAWDDPEFMTLLNAIDTTIDPDKRQENYTAIQQYVIDQAAVVPLYQTYSICAYNKDKISKWIPRTDEMLTVSNAEVVK